jgi:hypothetical protein
VGETAFAQLPMAAYGIVLLCAGCAYTILTRALLRLAAVRRLRRRAGGAPPC